MCEYNVWIQCVVIPIVSTGFSYRCIGVYFGVKNIWVLTNKVSFIWSFSFRSVLTKRQCLVQSTGGWGLTVPVVFGQTETFNVTRILAPKMFFPFCAAPFMKLKNRNFLPFFVFGQKFLAGALSLGTLRWRHIEKVLSLLCHLKERLVGLKLNSFCPLYGLVQM